MKQGDKVIYIGGQDYAGKLMYNLSIGSEFTVKVLGDTPSLKDTVMFEELPGISFIQSMFKVKNNNMSKFKKGDRVEFVENYDYNVLKGTKGTVLYHSGESSDLVGVNLDSGSNTTCYPYRLKLIEDRKIIGYKTPIVLFNEDLPAGTVYEIFENNKLSVPKGSFKEGRGFYSLPNELVKSWEPVYEEVAKDVKLVLGSNKIRITIGKNKLQADGKDFNIVGITKLLECFETNITAVSGYPFSLEIRIGCSTFSKTDIQKIVDTYKELNK